MYYNNLGSLIHNSLTTTQRRILRLWWVPPWLTGRPFTYTDIGPSRHFGVGHMGLYNYLACGSSALHLECH